MEIEQNIWGFTEQGEVVLLYTMRNASGAEVRLTNAGAAIVGATLPDRAGRMADVVLGYGDFGDYLRDPAAMGKTLGRYGGRIARGCFTLDGVEHSLVRNRPPDHLYGSLGDRLWQARVETDRVVFSCTSPEGEDGFPGELGVEVVYDWNDDCELEVTFYARGTAATVVNLANHTRFNLAGHDSGSVLGHRLQLHAPHYLPLDANLIPTGEILPVAGTPMDFTAPRVLAAGYEDYWAVDGWTRAGDVDARLREVALLADPVSGRRLAVRSTQPGVQVCTGNFLRGCPPSKSGTRYADRDGVSIICMGFPDAPNRPQFPSQRLEAGEVYTEKTVYRFSAL